MNKWGRAAFWLVYASGLVGCSSGGGGAPQGSFCKTLEARERACGLLGDGRTNCTDYFDAAESCETRCYESATCAELISEACSGQGPTSVCLGKCVGLAPVICADGTVLSGYARCDGVHSCGGDDDSDEAGCTQTGFKCRNVDEIVDPSKRCDHHKDCSDGSDETPDCDVVAMCKVGGATEDVLAAQICDTQPFCDDGSDEPKDCAAPLLCPTG